MTSPEQKNYIEIDRLEKLLVELRANRSTARETEAIREIGLEIATAIREVGAMLINVGWEQTFAADRTGTDRTDTGQPGQDGRKDQTMDNEDTRVTG